VFVVFFVAFFGLAANLFLLNTGLKQWPHKQHHCHMTYLQLMAILQAKLKLMAGAQAQLQLMAILQAKLKLMARVQAQLQLMAILQAQLKLMARVQAQLQVMPPIDCGKADINLSYISRPSLYRAVNMFCLRYKNQSVKNNRCLFSDPHKTHKYIVCAATMPHCEM
jgi:hypothetical protein